MKDPLWDVISGEIQTKEYIDGRNARFNGFKKEDNPYADLAYIEEYFERNSSGENLSKCDDWRKGWYAADLLKGTVAEMFEEIKNYTPSLQDQFVDELETLLAKYNFEITGVNNTHGTLEFKEGRRWSYSMVVDSGYNRYWAARPLGG